MSKVYDEQTGELVYAVRSPDRSFRPFVFEEGEYRVGVGDPETNQWEVHEGQQLQAD